MLKVPIEFKYNYEQVRKIAKPYLTKKDWLNWVGRNPK